MSFYDDVVIAALIHCDDLALTTALFSGRQRNLPNDRALGVLNLDYQVATTQVRLIFNLNTPPPASWHLDPFDS